MNPPRNPPATREPFYDNDLAAIFDLIVYEVPEAEADEEELAFLEWAFEKVARRPVRHLLDAGCGTGRFLIPLLRRGYRVTGLDRGAGALAECRRRLKKHGLRGALLRREVERLRFDRRFDAILGMDSVLGYIHHTDGIVESLRRFRRALRPGGVLVLSHWNVLARLTKRHARKPDVIESGGIHVSCFLRNEYDPFRSLFHIHAWGKVTRTGTTREFDHRETVRVMTPEETKTYLRLAKFRDIAAYPEFDPEGHGDPRGDFITFVARR